MASAHHANNSYMVATSPRVTGRDPRTDKTVVDALKELRGLFSIQVRLHNTKPIVPRRADKRLDLRTRLSDISEVQLEGTVAVAPWLLSSGMLGTLGALRASTLALSTLALSTLALSMAGLTARSGPS